MAKTKKVAKTRINGSKNAERLHEIILTAAKVFVEKGFAATSLDEVADVLKITRPALYYYFQSKQQLLFSIMMTGMDYLDKEVILPAEKITDNQTRLGFIITNHTRLLTGRTYYLAAVTSHDLEDLDPEQRVEINKRYRGYFDLIRGTLVGLHAEGKIYNLNLTGATFTILGMIIWLVKWYRPGGQITADEATELICNMAFQAILVNKQENISPKAEKIFGSVVK